MKPDERSDAAQLLRQDLLNFPPYTSAHVALSHLDRVIKLDANENPYGASPKAIAALAEMRYWNYYITQDELRPAIARYVGVDTAQVVVSNGADEMIDLAQRVFLNRGDAIVDCPPSFEMYSAYARVNAARVIEVPRRDDLTLDVDAIERAVLEPHPFPPLTKGRVREGSVVAPKIIFLANPSNPDGTLASRAEIERLLALPAIIVLDEAYAEFSGESYAARVPNQPNLIVLRTFSKWAGLASLRVGYCIAPTQIADQIMRTKSPYNVNAAGIVAARASLEDAEYLLANVRRIIHERERLFDALSRLGFLQPLPSHANFILCRVVGRSAKDLHDALARRGILIRAFDLPRLQNFVRISVGTPEQDDLLLRALAEAG